MGQKNYTDSLTDMIAYFQDVSQFKHRPDAAVWVTNLTDYVWIRLNDLELSSAFVFFAPMPFGLHSQYFGKLRVKEYADLYTPESIYQ